MAILAFSTNGRYVIKTTLTNALNDADTAGKKIVNTTPSLSVTTALTVTGGRTLECQDGGSFSVSGSGSITGMTYFETKWFGGSDIGAQINAGCLDRAAHHIKVSAPGAFSTSPNIPMGSIVDFEPGTYTQSSTWSMSHKGVIYNFNGSVFRTSVSAGIVFDIGKLAAVTPGTVNTSGTTVNWVSGPKFDDLDYGDSLIVNGIVCNIASIVSSTQLTVAGASLGTQSGVAYSAMMNPENTVNNSANSVGVVINDLSLSQASGAGIAIRGKFAFGLRLNNVKVNLAYTKAVQLLGCIGAKVDVTAIFSPIEINSLTAAGYSTGSNAGSIKAAVLGVVGGNAYSMLIANSGVVNLHDLRIEGNSSTYGLEVNASSRVALTGTSCFEQNGDGTSNAADLYIANGSTAVTVDGGQATTAGVTYNNGGGAIVVDATSESTISNFYINGNNNSYQFGINAASGAIVHQYNNTITGVTTLGGTVTTPNTGLKPNSININPMGEAQFRSVYAPTQELVYNGNMAHGDTAWTKGTGWTIPGNSYAQATNVTGNAAFSQSVISSMTIGSYYRLTFTIASYSTGTLIAYVNGSTGAAYAANGTYSLVFQQNTKDNSVAFLGASSLNCTLTNISLVPVSITADEIAYLNKSIRIVPKGPFANNAAAIAGGCLIGELYYVNAATDPQPVYIAH